MWTDQQSVYWILVDIQDTCGDEEKPGAGSGARKVDGRMALSTHDSPLTRLNLLSLHLSVSEVAQKSLFAGLLFVPGDLRLSAVPSGMQKGFLPWGGIARFGPTSDP